MMGDQVNCIEFLERLVFVFVFFLFARGICRSWACNVHFEYNTKHVYTYRDSILMDREEGPLPHHPSIPKVHTEIAGRRMYSWMAPIVGTKTWKNFK